MPVQTTYPGVYVEEIPSGVRTIIGVATSVTAFVGRSRRGPVNTPVTITSYGDFERAFGPLWLDGPMSYSVRDFYQNGGSAGVIVRLFHPTFASDAERADAAAAAAAVAGAVAGANVQAAVDAATQVAEAATNTSVPVRNAAAQTVLAAIKAAAAPIGATATVAAVQAAANAAVPGAAPVTKARFSVATAGTALLLDAAYEGSWGNALRIRIDYDVKPGDATLYNLSVKDPSTGEIEVFRNVSSAAAATRRIDKVLQLESRLLRVAGTPSTDKPTASGAIPAGGDPFGAASSMAITTQASDGVVLDANDYLGNEAAKTGLYALADADLFNLLVLPPHRLQVDGPNAANDIPQNVWSAAAVFCQKRRALLIIDAPSTWRTKDQAKTGLTNLAIADKNAALYFPRLKMANPLRDGQLEEFAASGAVAGVMARTDSERGVWKAPAGLDATLRGVTALSVPLTDGENGELNPLGINCLRTLPAAGRIVWGARTTRGDDKLADEWKFVPVRRTALFIEETLYRALHWVVFEPNDEPLWAQIRLNVGSFMHGLFRQGAFQGTSPRDAYFVKCDKESTTQADVDRGVVNVIVGFAPLKPAEFVVIRLQQMAGQLAT